MTAFIGGSRSSRLSAHVKFDASFAFMCVFWWDLCIAVDVLLEDGCCWGGAPPRRREFLCEDKIDCMDTGRTGRLSVHGIDSLVAYKFIAWVLLCWFSERYLSCRFLGVTVGLVYVVHAMLRAMYLETLVSFF